MATLSLDLDTLFVNSDKTNCPILACSIKQEGCGLQYTGNKVLAVKESGTYEIRARQNIEEGYQETVCISCTNGVQEVSRDRLTVEQTGLCASALVPSSLESVT